MIFKDKSNLAGEVEIRILDSKGKAKLIWQEFRFLHYIRKHFGINFPKLFGITGYLSRKACYQNLITTSGKGLITGRINGVGSPAAPGYMAIGTGASAAAAGDTALGTETQRVASTVTTQTTTVADDTAQSVGSFAIAAPAAITEMGILNAASVGTLLVRNVFSAYNVQASDTFEITHKLKNA
jgi:hypothetical protein